MTETKNLVIVESPAKAKTINKYLGDEYKVLASYGHIRDLPSKNGSVDPDHDFAMIWENSDDGAKRLKEIATALKDVDTLILSTDPDREGEAISWHLLEALSEKKALKGKRVVRVTFNEITPRAVKTAMENPRDVDMRLVEAYLARRALDYLVGFNLSPVLWRKLPGARSAGRVQSVALRLITERENEIERFIPQEYWSVETKAKGDAKEAFKMRVVGYTGEKLQKLDIPNEAKASEIVTAIEKGAFSVISAEAKPARRFPAPPFITSTLQQEAARKLGFAASRTMSLAQKLYEDGYITYMRTDGVNLSEEAISAIRKRVQSEFGDRYLPEKPIFYKSKAKNAQEAHEAIRPSDVNKTADQLNLDSDRAKLYELIRKRAVACQMEAAIIERTTVTAEDVTGNVTLRATGSVIKFDGFLRLYSEGKDDEQDEENRRLPEIKAGEKLALSDITPAQHFTEPSPRYTEASLVKKMEELGIGRPSTYAGILSVLQERNYVKNDKNRFVPEDKGRIVTFFLETYFKEYVEYDFTAELEERLDLVSDGKLNHLTLLADFWRGFKAAVDGTSELRVSDVIDGLNEELASFLFPAKEDGSDPRICPKCATGGMSLKLSKFGAFIGCAAYPECNYTRALTAGDNAAASGGTETVGTAETGEEITKRVGRFGPYLQIGEGKEAKRAGIPKFFQAAQMTQEIARQLLSLPREVGAHPETGLQIITGFGRFGAYLAHDGVYCKLPSAEDVLNIGLNHAVTLLAEKKLKDGDKKKTEGANSGKALGETPEGKKVFLRSGRYGAYVTDGKINATLPASEDSESLTLETALALLEKKAGAGAKKKPAAKKAPAKKAVAAKKPATAKKKES